MRSLHAEMAQLQQNRAMHARSNAASFGWRGELAMRGREKSVDLHFSFLFLLFCGVFPVRRLGGGGVAGAANREAARQDAAQPTHPAAHLPSLDRYVLTWGS